MIQSIAGMDYGSILIHLNMYSLNAGRIIEYFIQLFTVIKQGYVKLLAFNTDKRTSGYNLNHDLTSNGESEIL